jgi:hypothetical protein
MRKSCLVFALAAFLIPEFAVTDPGRGPKSLRARLTGFQEVPAVSTGAVGEFRAKVNRDNTEFTYELSYDGLRGNVTQAHIHLDQRGVNGGVSLWLCGTATNPGPAGTPTCPQSGTVSRTVSAVDVVGPAGQGVAAGQLEALLRAMRAGVTYANVHTTMWPGGEIRGQIQDEDAAH